jgi:hypothetical protein|tara:strand:+ start:196 stop:690 length:495 start_codon:yes stop_codon:yes gene_type:complete
VTRLTNYEVTAIVKKDILGLLKLDEPLNVFCPDANYCLYSEDFLSGKGYDRFKKWLIQRELFGWEHTFDCDNFAEAYRVFLQIVHARSQKDKDDNSRKQSVAVGVVWYTRDKGGGHAINIVISKEKGDEGANINTCFVKYLEPQTGEFVELSHKEKESISYVLL